MSSTEADSLARSIFREAIVPARAQGVFPRVPDVAARSYFSAPVRGAMNRDDFHTPGLESIRAFTEQLHALWRAEGHTELLSLASRLEALCEVLSKEIAAEDADVSPFVYAMF